MTELYRAQYRRGAMPKVAALLLVVLVAAACGGSAASPLPSTAPSRPPDPTRVPGTSPVTGADLLVTYETRGGECPNGPCGFKAEIRANGVVTRSDGQAQPLDSQTLEHLVQSIATADWDAIRAVPFTGECPVNFDGQEQIYTFTVESQKVVIESCTTAVDPAAKPFSTVQGILFGTGG